MVKSNTVSMNKGNLIINGSIIGGDYIGRDLTITSDGDKIIVNGSTVMTTSDKIITITLNGDAKSVETVSGTVNVYGNVIGNVRTTSGDVHVEGDVGQDVSTVSGDVEAEVIEGNVKTVSGNVSR